MANEATPVNGPYIRQDFTVLDAEAIEKGTLLKLSGARTVTAIETSGADVFAAGIAAAAKVASDGQTNIAVHRQGIFKVAVNPDLAVGAGMPVVISGANFIRNATAAEIASGAAILGRALQDGAASAFIEVDIGRF